MARMRASAKRGLKVVQCPPGHVDGSSDRQKGCDSYPSPSAPQPGLPQVWWCCLKPSALSRLFSSLVMMASCAHRLGHWPCGRWPKMPCHLFTTRTRSARLTRRRCCRPVLGSCGTVSVMESYEELTSMTDEQLIAVFDADRHNVVVGKQWYLDEMTRRRTDRASEALVKLTRQLALLTVLIAVLTAGGTVASVLALTLR